MNSQTKIISLDRLKRTVSRLRKKKKIAFTNGCFDILHYGHVKYLEAAKKPERILIVGLNSDSSIRRIKGRKRPILKERERAVILAALSCVDYVVIFREETPYKLIKALKPDILIKGADWRGKEVVGSDVVKDSGGKVEFVRYWTRFSTTNIIKTVLAKCKR